LNKQLSIIKRFLPAGLLACFLFIFAFTQAQTLSNLPGRIGRDAQGRPTGPANKMKGGDSLQQRDNNEDSITVFYRMYDSSRIHFLDSSVNDYYKRYAVPISNVLLGNLGAPTKSLIFSPNLNPGFDQGIHGYDNYRFTIQNTRVFQTTRPYTELGYLLGPRAEQTIQVLHTQNIRPAWNALFEFRLVNSPGQFANANTSHGNIRLSSSFATKNKRYSGNFMFINNRNRASESGGILSDTFLSSKNSAYGQRFNIPTWIGPNASVNVNPFSTNITTGIDNKNQVLFFRHQYDLGQKDSTYDADSAVVYLFYPRFRVQHTLKYSSDSYSFSDALTSSDNYNQQYWLRYGLKIVDKPLTLKDSWKDLTNEGAIVLFPEKNNQEQFFKAGAGYQLLQGQFGQSSENFSNLYLLGEYRNRTRNRKWDINASGRFYLAGFNAGDYNAKISLQSNLGKKLGILEVSFQNINRSPSFVYDPRSSFLLIGNPSFNKENWTVLGANLYIPALQMHLTADYYLISNYLYWNDFYNATQQSTLQNVLHIGGEKTIKISRRWNWYTEVHFQQSTGSDINLPAVYTRNRLVYEGQFYKNLVMAAGLDTRYYSPYQADDWSPFNGQWVVQNKTNISNRPDIAAFLQFRIRGLRIYLRAENINTVSFANGFGFTKNNMAAPLYPTPGFMLKIGFYWTFVN
jgi:hypothetical protein